MKTHGFTFIELLVFIVVIVLVVGGCYLFM
ncbi:MAG: prepilin-type N-terminal cleavage/methylation domain-containing protein [Akkermansia sp.]|nr:prepilin-type N-terminal cleavage/methylation domain-containing protein [Akkermansia sp.]MBQ8376758.1 prepilin-type N-terminal cleavage/methylation domain-containing protein [Akkermansia sp.]